MVGYIGDGGTSSSDFHAALNFAAVKQAPVVFFCQNNQWAISVPLSEQTASSSIAIKAAAYGVRGVRVDGNDLLAVITVMREAVERARSGGGPDVRRSAHVPHASGIVERRPDATAIPELVKTREKRDPVARFWRVPAPQGCSPMPTSRRGPTEDRRGDLAGGDGGRGHAGARARDHLHRRLREDARPPRDADEVRARARARHEVRRRLPAVKTFALVALGGGAGSVLRWSVSSLAQRPRPARRCRGTPRGQRDRFVRDRRASRSRTNAARLLPRCASCS